MQQLKMLRLPLFAGILLLALVSSAFARSWSRIETTMIGYEIGELKNREASLLEKRARLQMALARMTTKNHLTLLAQQKPVAKDVGKLASHRK